MAIKKLVQDIVPNENKRHSRKIIIEKLEEPEVEADDEIVQPTQASRSKTRGSKRVTSRGSNKGLITFIIVILSITIIGIALSLSYSKAIVTITPKVINFNIDGTFIAKKDALNDDLSYQVITATDSITQTITATKGPLIQTKAKGTVTIYNNYSTASQTLVAGTRIATSDGLTYRTSSTVSVPGKKVSTPGSVAVAIVAEQAGENYNLKVVDSKTNLNLPGYKGTPKFAGFYAKLKTDLTGGFSGNKMIIDPSAKKDTVTAIESLLKTQLSEKLSKNVPKEFILYKTAYNIEYIIPEPVMKGTDTAEMTVTGIAYGAIFNTKSLIKYIAGKEISKFPSDTYTTEGDKDLAFNISNSKDFSAKKGTALIFTLKGPIVMTGSFSEDDLKNQLKGIRLQDSNAVFAKYPSIANAYALITPFWMRSFPNSADKIKIEYKH